MMTQFCKHCGHLLPDGAKFCDACGASTEEAKTPFAAGPQYEPWHDAALQDKFLGFRGRLNRKRYFQRTLILAGLQVLLAFFFRLFQPDNPSSEELLHMAVMDAGFSFTMGELAARIIDAFLSVLQLGLALRRFHDLDRSWGSLFLLMIPFINLYFLFLLFLQKGNGWRQPLWPGSPHELREDPLMAEQLANNLWRLEILSWGTPLRLSIATSLQESATFSSIRGSMKKHVERPWWKN